jgi:hypothetical protein
MGRTAKTMAFYFKNRKNGLARGCAAWTYRGCIRRDLLDSGAKALGMVHCFAVPQKLERIWI